MDSDNDMLGKVGGYTLYNDHSVAMLLGNVHNLLVP